jgi:hypothetical protein
LIDSPLPPAVVLENLRARGHQWRESSVPDDLRKLGIINLKVETKGAQFEMRWGRSLLVYNPICFGIVQPYGDGSRIRAGFKLSMRAFLLVTVMVATAVLTLFSDRSMMDWARFAYFAIIVTFLVSRNRSAEPMRARLIEVLSETVQAPTTNGSAASPMMSTIGP